MTKTFVAVLAALLTAMVLAAPATAAPRGQRFWHEEVSSPQANKNFANVFDAYLARDPSGESLIDPKKCATHGDASCGTGVAFFEGIKTADPNATVEGQPLTLALVPKFLRKLELRDPQYSVKYEMDCMVRSNDPIHDPSGWKRLYNCLARYFNPGEKAYVDPDTNQVVLAQDCDNPVGRPERQAGCGYILVPVQIGDEVLMSGHGPTDTTQDVCMGLLRPGETDFESPAVERCAHPDCSLAVADAYATYPEQWTGSFLAEQSGWTVVRVPLYMVKENSGYQTFFCIHRADTTFYGLGVQWLDYLPRQNVNVPPGEQFVAIIQPDYTTAITLGRQTRLKDQESILWLDTDISHYQP